ncbi:protocadherin-8 [Xyrichtys novacula]|uniref:Protocadherin-8 n=1 Tax=Xyrichtys novacula TaxID=13765 RepID=A0AAV1H312_XYRNO|nr:protocadherin-8 [Xyrichtys novacula]
MSEGVITPLRGQLAQQSAPSGRPCGGCQGQADWSLVSAGYISTQVVRAALKPYAPAHAQSAAAAAALLPSPEGVQCTTTRYFTYEEDAPGTEIGNLSQDLKIDPADDPDTSFRFMQENNSSLIQMRETDGLLSVAEIIDREQLCPRSPRCFITFDIVAFSKEKFQLIHVEIEVKDINDHAPHFAHNQTNLEILENVPLGSRFPLQIALDQDVGENYIQSYNISPCSHFSIEVRDREDGVKFAELVLVRELDREVEDSYTIEVTATDGGVLAKSGSMLVYIKVLDFNDNSPTFEHSSLKVELNEDSPVGHRVLRVHAFDPDDGENGEVIYAFDDGVSAEVARVFHIDPYSGDVTLKALVDFEKRRSYELSIKASDLGANPVPSSCKVVIDIVDVNDNAPEISIKPMTSSSDGVAYITEAAAADSFVALISTSDRDSGSNGSFDYETLQQIELVILAEDRGSPSLSSTSAIRIKVVDLNDNFPYFTFPVLVNDSADIPLPFNAPAGFLALKVLAEDEDEGVNGELSFQIVQGDPKLFTMNKDTGEIALKQWLTAEIGDVLEIKIAVSDNARSPLSSSATIRFVVSDTEPSEDQVVIVLRSSDEEGPSLDGSLIVIIMLSGGCALLLIAIVVVVVTCKLSRGGRNQGSKREVCHSLFDRRPLPMLGLEPNIYTGQRAFFHERTSSSLDESCMYEERSGDSETKMFLPSKHFQAASVWQGDKYCLQVSGIGNTDQLSVKDSGKGDSDFNDSDSDISGDGGRKNFSTFQPRLKSLSSASNSLSGDCQGTYCAVQPQSFRAPRDNAYTIGFSPVPVFNNPHGYPLSWKDSGYGTNRPKSRSSMQSFSRTGTLPSYFPSQLHHEQCEVAVGGPEVQRESPSFVTVATALEVATIF